MRKESATKNQSFSLMRRFEQMYGDRTANYYKACLNALYNKQIIPSVIVGGGLKDARRSAERYLKDRIEKAERMGNIGKGNVTVSKPAKPTYSETDGYFYCVFSNRHKTIYWMGWTPTNRGAGRANEKALNLTSDLIGYGEHYSGEELEEKLNSPRFSSNLAREKKSIAIKGKEYNRGTLESMYFSAEGAAAFDYDILLLTTYSTEHLTRKEMKIFDKLVKLVKNTKRGSDMSLRKEIIRLAHQKPELREHLLPLIKKESGLLKMKVSEGSAHIRYRIENEGKRTGRCMVVFTYRVSKSSVVTQSLISDLDEFERLCFYTTKSLEKVFKDKDLGKLSLAPNFARVELDQKYPLISKYTIYFDIGEIDPTQIRLILENYFGATDIRS